MTKPIEIYFLLCGCFSFVNYIEKKRKIQGKQNCSVSIAYFMKIIFSFLLAGLSTNKLAHIVNGNITSKSNKNDFKYCYWNCDRGFLTKEKIEDIKILAQNKNLDIIGISEVELSFHKYTQEEIQEKFKIPNYKIFFPSSWKKYELARIIVYVKEDLKIKTIEDKVEDEDIQHVLLEVGHGKNSHFVDMYYREWKSCVTDENNKEFHTNYLKRLTNIWRNCLSKEKDLVAVGDTNIDTFKANKPGYIHQDVADIFFDFLYEENCFQLVDEITRSRKVNDEIQMSCLDHVTVNSVDKISQCSAYSIGNSDHHALLVRRRSKEARQRKRCLKKRIYKQFNEDAFLTAVSEAKKAGLFVEVTNSNDINESVISFNNTFSKILDEHAPIKVLQQHKNYAPYLSSDLKERIKYRDSLRKAWVSSGNEEIHQEYKTLRNKICNEIKKAKTDYYEKRLNSHDIKDAWLTTYKMLGQPTTNDFPQQMIINNKFETNPLKLAEEMNNFFVKKVTHLKESLSSSEEDENDALNILQNHLQENNKTYLNF